MSRDPGLQPERTAMAWLRTQLVTGGMGLLLFKIGETCDALLLVWEGVALLIVAFIGVGYSSWRFSKLSSDTAVVSTGEYAIKIMTSTIVAFVAVSYLLFMFNR